MSANKKKTINFNLFDNKLGYEQNGKISVYDQEPVVDLKSLKINPLNHYSTRQNQRNSKLPNPSVSSKSFSCFKGLHSDLTIAKGDNLDRVILLSQAKRERDKIAHSYGDAGKKICRADKFKKIIQQPNSSNAYYDTAENGLNLEPGILE